MDTPYPQVLYKFPESAGKPFQPSNGTEGMVFTEAFCERCIHERWCHAQAAGVESSEEDKCDIWTRTMVFNPGDKEYPREWQYSKEGWPICTKWSKWDWGSDDDDDGLNEPPTSPPPDPAQLNLFPLYPDELHYASEVTRTLQKEG